MEIIQENLDFDNKKYWPQKTLELMFDSNFVLYIKFK